tara:strand:+ start:1959 stop:2807 length:849 start_codon:yes stop_codon:yes gene_type:complete
MPHTEVNGIQLFHDEIGEGSPILFHHGYTSSHDTWLNKIAPQLSGNYRCIVMDCRGAGDSEHTVGGYTIEQYVDDVIGLADSLGLEKFTFLGHSMGGGIGMQLAINHPDRLEKLILVAPIPSGGTTPPTELTAVAQAMKERQRQLRNDPDRRDKMIQERKKMQIREISIQDIENSVDRAISISEGHFEQSLETMEQFNVTNQLGSILTPTLMISGAADVLAKANMEDLQRLPNATIHVFSRVGHSPHNDVPEEFATVVKDFLKYGVVNSETMQNKALESLAE